MDCHVIWTDPAIADLEDIVSGIARTSSPHARQVGEAILDHADLLADFPRLGPVYDGERKYPVRLIFADPYHVFYRVLEERRIVEIMHIRHVARRPPHFQTRKI